MSDWSSTSDSAVNGRAPAPQGFLDGDRNGLFQGWCFDPTLPGTRLKVEILIDNLKCCEVIADQFRSDLKDAGIGDGAHGFSVDLKRYVLDQLPHEIHARIVNDGTSLSNSPQKLAPGADAVHRRASPQEATQLSFMGAPFAQETTKSNLFKEISQELEAGQPVMICHPLVDWNLPLFQRPQHMAMAMAEEGILTIYCSPRWRYENFEGTFRLSEKLFITSEFESLLSNFDNLWIDYYSTCPTAIDACASSCNHRVVYEYVDHIDPEISGSDSAACSKYYQDLSRSRVGIFLATANVLYDELVGRFGLADTVLVPNGVDPQHYLASRDPDHVPARIRAVVESGKPIVGYFGAIASWLDISTLTILAEQRPDLEFVMIGPNYNLAAPPPIVPNIHWIGAVDYTDLPQHAVWFDCCIIPFRPGPIARSTSPLKLFEYFALQKAVVVGRDMHECTQYDIVRSASSAAEYSEQIDKALKDSQSTDFKKRSWDLAVANSWRARATVLAQAMRDRQNKPAFNWLDRFDPKRANVRGFNLEAPYRKVSTYFDRSKPVPSFGLSAGVFRSGDSAELSLRAEARQRSRLQGVLTLPENSPAAERDVARVQVWINGVLAVEDSVGHHGSPFEFSFCIAAGRVDLTFRLVAVKDIFEDWNWGKALSIGVQSVTVLPVDEDGYRGGWVTSPTAQMASEFRALSH